MDISSMTADKHIKPQYWLNIIHECRASSLTNQAWCEQNGIHLKSYYFWLARIRKMALENRKRYIVRTYTKLEQACMMETDLLQSYFTSSLPCFRQFAGRFGD